MQRAQTITGQMTSPASQQLTRIGRHSPRWDLSRVRWAIWLKAFGSPSSATLANSRTPHANSRMDGGPASSAATATLNMSFERSRHGTTSSLTTASWLASCSDYDPSIRTSHRNSRARSCGSHCRIIDAWADTVDTSETRITLLSRKPERAEPAVQLPPSVRTSQDSVGRRFVGNRLPRQEGAQGPRVEPLHRAVSGDRVRHAIIGPACS